MKYIDKNFIKYQENQNDNFNSYEKNRRIRVKTFYKKKLIRLIDNIWWNNLNIHDKELIMSLYYSGSKNDFKNLDQWCDYIKSEFKPDKVGLRNDKLKILGI